MMKVNCNVIKDLLPLYIDEVCSEETGKLVEEHTNTCDECLKLLNEMKTDINVPAVMGKAELKRMRHPFKKIRNGVILLCSLALLLVLGSIVPPLYSQITTEKYNIEINSDIRTIDFKQLYDQMADAVGADDGRLYDSKNMLLIRLDNNDNIDWFGVSFTIFRKGEPVHFETRLIKNNRLRVEKSWGSSLSKEEAELMYRYLPFDLFDRIPWDHFFDNIKTKDYDYISINNTRIGDGQGNLRTDGSRRAFTVEDNGEITELKERSALPMREYEVLNFYPGKHYKDYSSGKMEVEYFFKVK